MRPKAVSGEEAGDNQICSSQRWPNVQTTARLGSDWGVLQTAVFIGISMGFLSFCVDLALETLNTWKFGATRAVIRKNGGFWAPYMTFITISMGYCLLSALLVAYGVPLAAGSGIPEIKTYLNGVHIKGRARLYVTEGVRIKFLLLACLHLLWLYTVWSSYI